MIWASAWRMGRATSAGTCGPDRVRPQPGQTHLFQSLSSLPARVGLPVDVGKGRQAELSGLRIIADLAVSYSMRTGIPTRTSSKSSWAEAGYMRMQPCETACPIDIGLVVEWNPIPGRESPIQRSPKGFPGPAGTAISPRPAHSGGSQVGLTTRLVRVKEPWGWRNRPAGRWPRKKFLETP